MTDQIDWESLQTQIEGKKAIALPDIFLDHLVFTDRDHNELFNSIMEVLQGKARNIIVKQQIILGGNAFNAVLTSASLGLNSVFIGSTDRFISALAKATAPTKLTCMITEIETANITTSFEIGEEESKKNVMFSTTQALSSFNPQSIDIDQQAALEQADAIMLSNWGMTPKGTELLKQLCGKKKPNQRIFFDPADVYLKKTELPELIRILKDVEFLCLNEFEYLALNQEISKKALTFDWIFSEEISPLQKTLPKTQIIIHTANRVYGRFTDKLWTIPTFDIKPQFVTGLGDTFLGGFVTGILGGLESQQAASLGSAVVGYYAVNGERPTLKEAQEFMKQIPLKKLQLSSLESSSS
ncbi:MAG: carbohydrate kinase family protein [Promethearchaeota archaeon]